MITITCKTIINRLKNGWRLRWEENSRLPHRLRLSYQAGSLEQKAPLLPPKTRGGHVLSWDPPSESALTSARAPANVTVVSSERFILNPAATEGPRGSWSLDSAQLLAASHANMSPGRSASKNKQTEMAPRASCHWRGLWEGTRSQTGPAAQPRPWHILSSTMQQGWGELRGPQGALGPADLQAMGLRGAQRSKKKMGMHAAIPQPAPSRAWAGSGTGALCPAGR